MHVIGAPAPPHDRPFDERPVTAHPSPADGRRVWLLRHGEVEERYHDVAYGQMDVPLSERGRSQTAGLEASFRGVALRAVCASHLSRARLLGEALARATGAELLVDPELREIDRGEWQGLSRAEFAERWHADAEAFHREPFTWKAHRGESDADVWARVGPALDRGVALAADGDLALCAHYNVLRVLVTRCLGWSPRESFAFRCGPGRLCLLQAGPTGWQLLRADADGPA